MERRNLLLGSLRAGWRRSRRPLMWTGVVVLVAFVAATGVLGILGWNVHDDPRVPQIVVRPGMNHFAVISGADSEAIVHNSARATRAGWFTTSDFPFLDHEVLRVDTLPPLPPNGTFTTQTAAGADWILSVPSADHLRVAFLADTGTGPQASALLRQVAQAHPDVVVHAGDIAYSEYDEEGWDAWGRLVTSTLPGVPFAYVTGNHDTDDGVSRRQIESLRGPEAYYSFDLGPVHFVILDANHITDAQTQWLGTDLGAAETAGRPWIVPVEHQPWWSSGIQHGSDVAARDAFAAQFGAHGVRLAVSGHEHNYERTRPIDGVTYVVTGGGGRSLYSFATPQPPWSAFRATKYEFFLVEFQRQSFSAQTIAATGEVLDAFQG